MNIVNLLVLIIFILGIALVLMASMNAAKKSDDAHNRGTEQTRSKGSGIGVVLIAVVIMAMFLAAGIAEGLPYKSASQDLKEFTEIMKNGSIENFWK